LKFRIGRGRPPTVEEIDRLFRSARILALAQAANSNPDPRLL